MCPFTTAFFDQMPEHARKEIIHKDKIKDKIFTIKTNMWDNAIIKSKSVKAVPFPGQSNSMIYN
jgi:hypothetical protein